MKIIVIILILATLSMAFHIDEQQTPSYHKDIRSVEKVLPKSKKHDLKIERETGLDGKVRSIRLDLNDDVPGVRAYGIPKNKLIDSRKMEKSNPSPVLRGDPRSSRVLEDLDQSEKKLNKNGRIERVPFVIAKEKEPLKLSRHAKRSVQNNSKNSLEEDLQSSEAKVFRPLFVYRQQVDRRKAQNEKKRIYKKKYDQRITQKFKPINRYPNRVRFY